MEIKHDPRQTRFVGGLSHLAGWQEVDVGGVRPEGVVGPRIGDGLSVSSRVGSFKVKHQRNELEVNGRVCVDEAQGNRLFHASVDRFVVLVAKPFEAGEDGGGVLAGSEGGIIIQEAFCGFKGHEFIIVVHDLEVKWISCLVTAVPEVRNSTHVGVSRGVDGRDEPLRTGLRGVGDNLAHVFLGVGLTVAVGVVVSLHPVVEFQLHGMADLVFDEHLNHLLVGRCLIGVFDRCDLESFRMCSVHKVGATPFGVGLLNVVGVSLVVGLDLVGQTVGHIDVGQVDGDKERAVVVGRVPCRGFDVAVSGNANVKGAVFGSVIGVLEPHRTHEVELLARSDPRAVFNVHGGQLTIVGPDIQPAKAEGTVHSEPVFGDEWFWCETCRAAVVQTADAEADVVLVGHLAGDKELPVNLEHAVALH